MSENKPALTIRKGSELPLSGESLVGLLSEVLAKRVPFRFRALGYSMFPFIRDGDVIIVCPKRRGEPRFGDVAAYLRPETRRLAVHRMIGRKKDGLVFKGDYETTQDDAVPESDVLGIVHRVDRKGRRIVFGMGPERRIIAWLSTTGILLVIFRVLRGAKRAIGKVAL